jgi:hypothetical protein
MLISGKPNRMKKIFSLCLMMLTMTQIGRSQTTNITGTVNSQQGKPLHFVFIHDQKSTNATFTDSLGSFSITTNPAAVFQFEATGYKDTLISGDKLGANAQIVLASSGSASAGMVTTANSTLSTKPISTGYLANENISNAGTSGGIINGLGHQKGNVHGNRYLFDDFAHGFVVNAQGALYANPIYLYDYDKIGGGIMLSVNNGAVSQLDDAQIKTITLFSNDDKTYVLAKVPLIDNGHYVQVLASGSKYNIYKATKTTFVKSDYVNNGVTTHGNDYDEFDDDFTYYILDVQANQVQKIAPKKKALKTAFVKDADKVNKYLADHSGDIDDVYLAGLGAYMNQ